MSLPPGPRGPAFAQAVVWALRSEQFMRRCHRRYGNFFTVRVSSDGPSVFIADPAAIKEIFTGDAAILQAGAARTTMAPMFGPRSILLLDGADHMRQRKLMLPSFHGERMARYSEVIRDTTERALASWPRRRPFKLQPRLQDITLEVIMRAVFGIERPARLAEVRGRLLQTLEMTASSLGELAAVQPWLIRDLGRFSPGGQFRRAVADADAVLLEEIRARRAAPSLADRDDVLSLLLQARDESGEPMTDDELRDQLVTLLLAGHETTATALAWGFERLLRRPDALERATAEARGEHQDGYIDAIVTEILRLRPPVPITDRRLAAPFEAGGWTFPAGTTLFPAIWLVHRRADLYPDPDRFLPERFLGSSPDTYTWLPFGGGVRRCLGAAFATFEMKLVLRTILASATLRAANPRPEPSRRRAIVLAPGRGARAVLV
jgi:cytochrome P450 family 135